MIRTREGAETMIISSILSRLRNGGKILIFGNGGSAAQAQHFAAELMGRYKRERPPIPCVALTTDTSLLTAIANDYGYGHVFERQVRALCLPMDIVIGVSTSGKSPNVIAGLRARPPGALGVAFVGTDDLCEMARAADYVEAYEFDAHDTPHIQESQLEKLHKLAEAIEDGMFGEGDTVCPRVA